MSINDIYNNRGGRLPRRLPVGVSFAESGGGQGGGGGGGGDVGGDQSGVDGSTFNTFTLKNIEPSGSGNARTYVPYQTLAIFDEGEIASDEFAAAVQITDINDNTVSIVHATQTDVKTRHDSDGSIKTAVVTGLMPTSMTVGQEVSCRVDSVGNNAAGTEITKADILAANADMRISLDIGGTVYTATLKEALNATTIDFNDADDVEKYVWRRGALCTELKEFSIPFKNGGTNHPQLTARFQIAGYWDGQAAAATVTDVKMRGVIENTRVYEDADGNTNTFGGFTADVTFESTDENGTFNRTLFNESGVDLPRQARIPAETVWSSDGNTLPELGCLQLPQQGITQRFIPNFTSVTAAGSTKSGFETEADARTLNDTLSMPTNIGGAGHDGTIGAMPYWACLYYADTVNQGRELYKSIKANAEAGGLYHVHFRDENTDEPIKRTDWPYFGLSGSFNDHNNPSTGLNEAPPGHTGNEQLPGSLSGLTIKGSHFPQANLAAYLLEGDPFYLEQLRFCASWAIAWQNPAQTYGGAEKGLLKRVQHRTRGWGLNAIVDAWLAEPDGTDFKAYLKGNIDNQLNYTFLPDSHLDYTQAPLGFYTRYKLHSEENIGTASSGNPNTTYSLWMGTFELQAVAKLAAHLPEWVTILDWMCRGWAQMLTHPDFCKTIASGYRLAFNPASENPAEAADGSNRVARQDWKSILANSNPTAASSCFGTHADNNGNNGSNMANNSYGVILRWAYAILGERGYKDAVAEHTALTTELAGADFTAHNNFYVSPIVTDSTERAMPFDDTQYGHYFDMDNA
jgi:hypothetical protein